MAWNRREWLTAATACAASGAWNWGTAEGASSRYFDVESVERTTVALEYRDVPARHMARELPHWVYFEIVRARLKSGAVGVGESMLFYTWGATEDADVERIQGKNAVDWIWDDALGSGLQMALFDAVAQTADVPIHRLLGAKVHDTTPLSWWNIDTSAEDMASECREAFQQGYLSYKTKGRPWFDVWDQVAKSAAVVPETFRIDMDFNDTLLDADRAIPILKDLERYPQVAIYETPIPQGDIAGNRAIREATRVAVAMHYGNPPPVVAIREAVCDGFVVGGGASSVLKAGTVAAMADLPFWLQLVGTGITAAFSLHLGGVLSHATWPAVNCHQLFRDNLLVEPIRVRDGVATVPDAIGLGHSVNWDSVARLRVDKPARRPEPQRLLEIRWPNGRTMDVAGTGEVNFLLTLGQQGKIPYYERGVTTELVPNDGSSTWKSRYDKARSRP
ncbi:MAG: dgoA protein [Planctomycetes bacterium]|nr:dgoA protein [Planctomycetota bacterium]